MAANMVEETPDDRFDSDEHRPVSDMDPHDLGLRGERAAERYLRMRGYEIVERNWTCFAGEADLIARDGDCIVFVEVKTRSNLSVGLPEEAVDAHKKARYEKIAACYLREMDCGIDEAPVRFDVIGLLVVSRDRALVRHHINAFGRP